MTKKVADIDLRILAEDVLTMSEAAQEFPRAKHVSCLYRWAHRGVRGHRLATVRLGAQLVTSRQAITRFLRAINDES